MKVVQVSQSYHPRPGGVTEHVDHVTRELRRRGHDVTIVTSNFGNHTRPDPGVVRVGRNLLVPMNGAWVNATVGWHLWREVSGILGQLKPDIIHTHCPLVPTLPLMALSSAPRNARVVGTFHAAADRSMGYRLFRQPLDKLAKRFDTRIAVSNAARALAQTYFPGEYVIVPNGVDCARFCPEHTPIEEFTDDAFNILFVGRMDRRKGLKYLFRAVSLASRQTSRKLRLIVVGDDGPRRYVLPRLAAGVELVFTGVVSRDLLPRYFVTGDCFCSPAIDRESFGIVLLEAMASGIPVIGTGIPGYLTILRDGWNALVVPPRDPIQLASAILRLIQDDTIHWKLRINGLEFARRYRWERVVDLLEAVYRQDSDIGSIWSPPADAAWESSPWAGAQKA